MQGFPVGRRASATLVAGLLLALGGASSAAGPAGESALREAARPGAFCTPSLCRPRSTTGWTAAAFGAVVIAMGWQARRREDTGAGHPAPRTRTR